MRWDHWVGSAANKPTLLIKWLFHRWGRRIDLHKMVKADEPHCYHTHPARRSFRLILWGGYIEEMEDGTQKTWYPGMMGWVDNNLSHRIAYLLSGRPSYSLWFRGRVEFPILLRGDGWSDDVRQGAPQDYVCEDCGLPILAPGDQQQLPLLHSECRSWREFIG